MDQWYHSGIEGYCKAAAQLMGLPNDASGWGNFGQDLFGDNRFDDPVKASKTWTLSRSRKQGRSNRPVVFEKSWLGKSGPDCEVEAIAICAQSIADEKRESTLRTLYESNYLRFALGFRETVVPAIADGFRTERYHSADIVRFTQSFDELLGDLSPSDSKTFRNLATSLVAALIYGPSHPSVRSATIETTMIQKNAAADGFEAEVDDSSIRITQLFSANSALMGYSELFDDDKVILLGRSSDQKRYLDKCNPSFSSEIESLQPVFYPISNSHKRTSNEHGAIARIGDTWYYHDFSSNGSYIENEGILSTVHGDVAAIRPGDKICLGLTGPSESPETAYKLSTMLLVSFGVYEGML